MTAQAGRRPGAAPLGAPWFTLAAGLGVALCVFAAAAQSPAVPATRDMIDALNPARSRNLQVRQRPDATAPDQPEAPPGLPEPPPTAPASPPAPAPAQPPGLPSAPTGIAPAEPPPSLSLAIQFELNSAHVRPESGAVLGNLVAAMLSPELKTSRFVIEGHTDARGSPAANLRLSQDRAEEVRLFLVALGVGPARLKAVGKGASQPANPRDPLAAENRRVRVVTLE